MKRAFGWIQTRLVSTFLAGLFALLPLVITVAIVAWVINFLNSAVGPETTVGKGLGWVGEKVLLHETAFNEILAHVVGWLLVLAAIFGVGLLVKARAWTLFDAIFNPVVRRIPIINSVYGTASQFVSMLKRDDQSQLSGMSVVFCSFGETPGAGILALSPTADEYEFGGERFRVIYIPTSPVPMTGGLIYVPSASVKEVDMKVEALMTFYLSMGVTAPATLAARIKGHSSPAAPVPTADDKESPPEA